MLTCDPVRAGRLLPKETGVLYRIDQVKATGLEQGLGLEQDSRGGTRFQ
jgi:hypothetical protein